MSTRVAWPAVRVLLVITMATAVSQSFGRFTYSLLFTDIRDDLGVSNTVAGSLGSGNLVAYVCGTLVVSLVVGRLGLGILAVGGLIAVTGGLALLAWGPTTAVVAIALFVTGFSAAGVWVTAPGLATAQLGAARRGVAIGIVGGGVGLGIVIASILDTVAGDGAWRTVYRIEFAIAVVVSLLALLLIERVPSSNAGPRGLDAIRSIPHWQLVLLAYGLFATAMALIVTFLVGVLEEDAGYSAGRAAFAFSVFGVGTMGGGPLFGALSDRIGRERSQILALVVMASTALVVATGHRPIATIAAFVIGLSFTAVPVTVGATIGDHVDAESFGAAYGIATLAFGAGLAVGPQLGGIVADSTDSFRPVFVLAASCAIVAAFVTHWSKPALRK